MQITFFCRIALMLSTIAVALVTPSSTPHGQVAPTAQVGQVFPIDLDAICDQSPVKNKVSLKLVAFMPDDSDYEGMMALAFDRYFVQRGAFSSSAMPSRRVEKILIKSPSLRAPSRTLNGKTGIDVTGKTADTRLRQGSASGLGAGQTQVLALEPMFTKKDVPSDCILRHHTSVSLHDAIAKPLSMAFPKANETSATVFLLDENNVIRWRDDDYRAQGEHLKPLERTVKALLGVPDAIAAVSPQLKPLTVGDIAPNFKISEKTYLTDLRGKTVLVTFYPAAFSGTLDMSMCTMCCFAHLRLLANSHGLTEFAGVRLHESQRAIERIAISASTETLLTNWSTTLNASGMTFVNDPDYAISQAYESYDRGNGHNRRTVFIVDPKGKIAFVDWDYKREDTEQVIAALDRISGRVAVAKNSKK
ncbi:MAG: redoxin domain-containing protein [Casimicrobium sp.]